MTPVLIAADEQIIGVKAKLYKNHQAVYTVFYFMVCKRVWGVGSEGAAPIEYKLLS